MCCCCLVAESHLTLATPMDYSLPGFSVHGISQVRVLEWVAVSFSRVSFWPRDQTHVSCIGRRILYHSAIREACRYECVCVCVCVCVYSHIFLHSSVDGHLGCFCVLAIVKSAAMNIRCMYFFKLGFPGGASGREPAYQCRRPKRWGFDRWVRNIPWSRKWQPTPVCFLGESHGPRSLAGYSP